jgi:Zn-dependent M28 family amino/carboxypeptidase
MLWIALFACTSPTTDDPAELVDALSPDVAIQRDHLEALYTIAMDHDGNRAAATPGFDASVDYVEAYLTDLGLTPTRVPFFLRDFRVVGTPTLTAPDVDARDGDDFQVMNGSGSGQLTAPTYAVDVTLPIGDGTSDSACEDADFADFPVGAVALIQRGTCSFQEKIDRALAAGAVAVVLFNEGQAGRRDVFDPTINDDNPTDVPLIAASTALGEDLIAAGTVTLDVTVERTEVEQHNVLVTLPGATDAAWMVGAHLDSVPAGPGINDNGTGVVAVLELARVLAAEAPLPGDGVTLALWGAEEIGLLGSLAWVDDATDAPRGYLNLDMVGSPNPGRFIYDGDGSATDEAGPTGSKAIESAYADHFDAAGLPHLPTALDGRSDYLGFMLAGIPSGGLFTGASEPKTAAAAELFGGPAGESYDACYHQSCDTVDNVDFDLLEQSTVASLAVLRDLAAPEDADARARRAPAAAMLPIGGCGGHGVTR